MRQSMGMRMFTCVSREGGLRPCAAMFDTGTCSASVLGCYGRIPTFYVKVVPDPEVDLVFSV